MNSNRGTLSCRWAEMTLLQRYPIWFSSEACPWCCRRTVPPRPLETTEACATCAHWQPRNSPQASYDRTPR
jgi:hypothetical protein